MQNSITGAELLWLRDNGYQLQLSPSNPNLLIASPPVNLPTQDQIVIRDYHPANSSTAQLMARRGDIQTLLQPLVIQRAERLQAKNVQNFNPPSQEKGGGYGPNRDKGGGSTRYTPMGVK